MTYVHVEQVEDMIKDWQQSCADYPAIYNQGNVLRDRLAKLTSDIEVPIDEVTVSGWGVWKDHAIPREVCRYIASKVNSLISASAGRGAQMTLAEAIEIGKTDNEANWDNPLRLEAHRIRSEAK